MQIAAVMHGSTAGKPVRIDERLLEVINSQIDCPAIVTERVLVSHRCLRRGRAR